MKVINFWSFSFSNRGELKLSNVGPPRAWASLVEEKESAEADINIAR